MTRIVLLVLGLGVLSACSPPAEEVSEGSWERWAEGTEFMVAAPTPQAMEAGRSVLEEGGNAVDAAAAAAFALWVTDPLMASVGAVSYTHLTLPTN